MSGFAACLSPENRPYRSSGRSEKVRPGAGGVDRISFLGESGAKRLNSLVVEAWPLLLQKGRQFQVIHVTGRRILNAWKTVPTARLSAKILPYCHEMAHAYAAADAVVCRPAPHCSGGLGERGARRFLSPYPYASNNHQVYNARVIEESGLGVSSGKPTLRPSAIAEFLESAAAIVMKPLSEACRGRQRPPWHRI